MVITISACCAQHPHRHEAVLLHVVLDARHAAHRVADVARGHAPGLPRAGEMAGEPGRDGWMPCTYVCTHTYIYICDMIKKCIYIYVYICMYVCNNVCMYACMHVCMYVIYCILCMYIMYVYYVCMYVCNVMEWNGM